MNRAARRFVILLIVINALMCWSWITGSQNEGHGKATKVASRESPHNGDDGKFHGEVRSAQESSNPEEGDETPVSHRKSSNGHPHATDKHRHHRHHHDDNDDAAEGDNPEEHQVEEHHDRSHDAVKMKVTPKPWKDEDIPRSKGNSLNAAVTEPVVYPVGKSKLSFAVIGDWGGPGRQPQRDVAAAMETTAVRHGHSAEKPLDFVISTGDNMYEDGVSSVHDPRFKSHFEKVYTQPTVQCRWYMSLGNHDHGAHGVLRDVQAQVNYTQHSKKWFLPSTYYTQKFVVPGSEEGNDADAFTLELFVLDTYDVSPRLTRMTPRQLKWFAAAMKNSTADWRLVVGHRPLFSAGLKHGSSPYMQKKLMPIMKKFGAAAYLSGDDHDLQVLKSGGVHFFLSGGGARAKGDLKKGGVKQTLFQKGVHGFMHFALQRDSLMVEVVNKAGEVLEEFNVPRPTIGKKKSAADHEGTEADAGEEAADG